MASENAGAGDKYEVQIHGGGNNMAVDAPAFVGDFECWGKDESGNVVKMWHAPFKNVVVDQGRALILNRMFASSTYNSQGALLFLHSATTASNRIWGDIAASQVVSYGNSIPAITFSSAGTASNTGTNYMTATASYAFNASTQTVSGAGILFYTSASGGTNLASSDVRLYCYGLSAASQLVQNGNTLSATVTVSYNSTT